MLIKQTFTNTIQGIDKTLGTSLNGRLAKVILLISAAILIHIASIKSIIKLETVMVNHLFKEYSQKKDIIRLSLKEFNELNKFSIDNHCLNLQDYCLAKNINAYVTCKTPMYPKIASLFNAKDDPSHPFYGKKYSELIHIYSDEYLFNKVKGCVPDSINKWENAIVLSKEMFNNKLLDIAKHRFVDNYEVSVFLKKDFEDLYQTKKNFLDKIFTIGTLDKFTYVANKIGELKKYNEYIQESIKKENK